MHNYLNVSFFFHISNCHKFDHILFWGCSGFYFFSAVITDILGLIRSWIDVEGIFDQWSFLEPECLGIKKR